MNAKADAVIVVRRTIHATPEELYDAWLDPESLSVWMRPMGIPSSTARVDARVGGTFEVVMHGRGGDLRHFGVYRALERPKRLVFTWTSDATEGVETQVTVDLVPEGSATVVVVTHERLPSEVSAASHTEGWTDALRLLETSSSPTKKERG